MAFSHGKSAVIYTNGYNLTGYLKQFSASGSADVAETTVFGAQSKSYIAGQKDASLSAEGLFDGSADAVDQVLNAALGASSDSIWTWFPAGAAAVGDDGYGFSAIETGYEISSPVGDVVSVTAEAQSNTGLERVDLLHVLAARTVDGTGTALDNTASSSNGAAAYLQVTAAAGTTPSITVKVQHSSDNVAWTDLITFDAVTAANKAQRKAVTGTVNRYVRVTWTITGTSPSFTFAVAVNRK